MAIFRFIITPVSPWADRLNSDTLNGLVCLYAAEKEGDAFCRELIAAFEAGRPPFVLSSVMAENCLPMPVLPPAPPGAKFADDEIDKLPPAEREFARAQKFKKFRKKSWISLDAWQKVKNDLSLGNLFQAEGDKERKKGQAQGFEPHVAIDRATGAAAQGQLFFRRLTYFDPETRFHLYGKTDDPDWLLKYLQLIGQWGFGRDASSGNGQFEVSRDNNFDESSLSLADPGSMDARLLLSVCAAPDMNGLDGYYRLEVKRGKTAPGHKNPFKKPFLMLREGAILKEMPKGAFVLRNLNADPAIVQITQPFSAPCRLSREIRS
ncbi:MAG: hypothetical protein K2H64_08900 [Desulfovibrio sp.]|nr:hypothetical protein [Desulfovibrio sp.]